MVKCPPVRAYEPQPAPLGGLLKRCRARLKPESGSFGPHLRLPIRVGKAVSQEELAEALGISRQWYVRLESDRQTGVSPSLLARIADALAMDLAERDDLFRLALPELRTIPVVQPRRSLIRRLWAANTEAEVLTIVREYAMTTLRPDIAVARTRVAIGHWEIRRRATNPAANAWRASTRCFANARAKPPWTIHCVTRPWPNPATC